MTSAERPRRTSAAAHRRTVRYLAAAIAGLTAALYLLVGLEVLQIVDVTSERAPGMLELGSMAGAAFLFGAVLLIATDRRILWVLGALFQAAVIVMQFAVGPQRTPSFKIWGLTIKALQLVLLGLLVFLAVRPAEQPQAQPA